MNGAGSGTWEDTIQAIITADSNVVRNVNVIQNPIDYIRTYREIPVDFDYYYY